MSAHVALVTYAALPDLSQDDRLLRDALRERGANVDAVVWDDRRVRWTRYDAVVVRSTWDYHHRADEFRAWIERMERDRVALWNPPGLLRWNLHKRYLIELAERGVSVVPTLLVPRGSEEALESIVHARGWREVVVKPAVSATAWKTLAGADATEAAFRELAAAEDVLVQPFLEEVREAGEWSLVFVAGELSHAVIKRPRAGDFRVQNDFGGTAEAATPEGSVVEQAQRTLATVGQPWLYARVDGVVRGGTLLLMELELTEPALFFGKSVSAAAKCADAILRVAGHRRRAFV